MNGDSLQDLWTLQYELGLGTFAKVFSAVETASGDPVVIKYPLRSAGPAAAMLEKEAKTMRHLQHCASVPRLIDASHCPEYIVMEKVGKTLLALKAEGAASSPKTVIMVALKVLDALEQIHNCGYIHRDLKPDNIAIALEPDDPRIFLIDFGLSSKFMHAGMHVTYTESEGFEGTPYFASLNSLRGLRPSRRDDLESLGYILLYLLHGSLPWFQVRGDCKSRDLLLQVLKVREKHTPKSLALPCYREMGEYLTYCQELQFAEKPNYATLRQFFYDWARRIGVDIDWVYDWCIVEDKHTIEATEGNSHSTKKKHVKHRLTAARLSPSKNMSTLEGQSPGISPGQKINSLRRFSIQPQGPSFSGGSSSNEDSSPDLVSTPKHRIEQLPAFRSKPFAIQLTKAAECSSPRTAVLPDIAECEEKHRPARPRRFTCDEFTMSE